MNEIESEDSLAKLSIRKCENKICLTIGPIKSNMWVKSSNSNKKSQWLCVTCYKAWRNNQYCYYCDVIYVDGSSSNYNDPKNWVMCDFCDMWQHIKCEEDKGHYQNLSNLIEDSQFKYMCPTCRKKTNYNDRDSNIMTWRSNSSKNVAGKRKYIYKRKGLQGSNEIIKEKLGVSQDYIGQNVKN